MRVGLISYNGRARDAVGNHLAEKLAFFLERGADVRVVLECGAELHPGLAGHVHGTAKAQASGPVWDFLNQADLVIVDFAQDYELLHFLPLLVGCRPRLVLEYHGITPPQYFNGPQRANLERAQAMRGIVWCADYALVHSRFTWAELVKATGFPDGRMVQLDFPVSERLHPGQPEWSLRASLGLLPCASAGAPALLLYVGRVAANKSLPTFIEAIAQLRDMETPVHAAIVGDSTDVYAEEQKRCVELGKRLGIADRVHFIGSLSDDRLADCYRDADALVIPSLHEGFCIPALEALASGLPVIGARAGALPQTIGGAGLTFAPGDAGDLARQIRRVVGDDKVTRRNGDKATQANSSGKNLSPRPSSHLVTLSPCHHVSPGKVALVCFRFGAGIIGGAETSLRKIAHALLRRGKQVEVFTTCTRAESDWTNTLPAGTTIEEGLAIHRFPIDRHDRSRHLESVRTIIENNGCVDARDEQSYLDNSIHAQALIAKLTERSSEFDAIITGPYLFGLTWDIARAFSDKTLLLACFHQEPLARLKAWPAAYSQVGGILYHSPEERELAEIEVGINHPNGVEIGTWLAETGDTSQNSGARADPHFSTPYLVYCGRYSRQKDLPRLLELFARYQAERPGRFHLVCMGQGEVTIPEGDGIIDLGHVDEATKKAVLAGAAALVQLSRHESLSLVVLEAWAQGTPVLVDSGCAVLSGQIKRSGGGVAIADDADFTRCLDELWDNPDQWRQDGRRGQAYVNEHYASEGAFVERITAAIANLRLPLRELMRRRGLARAEDSRRAAWRQRFGLMVERVLDDGPRPARLQINIEFVHERLCVKAGTKTTLVPVRVHNQGVQAVLADGPARSRLLCTVGGGPVRATALSGILMPGRSQAVAVLANVPEKKGDYLMQLWLGPDEVTEEPGHVVRGMMSVGAGGAGGCSVAFVEAAREALIDVNQRRELPADYLDVTEGRLARWKRWIKQKLLGNFKRGYVDVLSRQQSQVNRHILTALHQLTECCATLDHALRGLQERIDELEEKVQQSADSRDQNAAV